MVTYGFLTWAMMPCQRATVFDTHFYGNPVPSKDRLNTGTKFLLLMVHMAKRPLLFVYQCALETL